MSFFSILSQNLKGLNKPNEQTQQEPRSGFLSLLKNALPTKEKVQAAAVKTVGKLPIPMASVIASEKGRNFLREAFQATNRSVVNVARGLANQPLAGTTSGREFAQRFVEPAPVVPKGKVAQALVGSKPFNFKTAASDVEQTLTGTFGVTPESAKKWSMPMVLVGSLLDLTPAGGGLGKGARQSFDDVVKIIAKSKKVPEIVDKLVATFKFSRKQANELAPILRNIDNVDDVKRSLEGFINTKITADIKPSGFGQTIDIKQSGFGQTVAKSPLTAAPVAEEAAKITYDVVHNADTMAKANARIAQSADEALSFVKNTPEPNAETYATALELIKKYQNEGNYQQAIDIINDIAPKATKQGQAIQILSMYNRLTPEGVVRYATGELNKVGKGDKMTPALAEKLVEKAKAIQKLPEGEEKMVETALMMKEIRDLMPASIAKKVSTIQTMFQLLNPKTFTRNIIGNIGFAGMENISDVVATPFDSALSLFTKKRTKALPSIGAQAKGFREGLRQGIRDAMLGIDTSPGSVATQFDLPTNTFGGGVGRAFEKALNISLRGPDRAFYKAAYDGSLASQLKANKFKNIADVPADKLDEMKEIAHLDGLYRTFQDDNALSKFFQNIKIGANKLTGSPDFGIGDFILKYPKTPANLLRRGIAYSPIGLVNTLVEATKGLTGRGFNQKRFVETFSRALVGTTMQIGLGAWLHKMGIISGKREDNANINAVERREGLGQYKINASALKRFVMSGFDPEQAQIQRGDKLVSYDWFQPFSIGLSIGANFDEGEGGADTVLGNLLSGIDTLAEQPLVQGVTRFLKTRNPSEGVTQLIESIPASFVPSIVNQIRQATDDKARSIYDTNFIGRVKRSVMNRIPGLSEQLEPKVNVFGGDQRTYEAGENKFFNVFFNPAFVTEYKGTPEGKLVLDIFKQTGDVSQAPKLVEKKQTINGKKIELSPEQYTALQRFSGTYAKELLTNFAASPEFQALPEDMQVKIISNALSDISAAGRIILLGNRPTKAPSRGTQSIIMDYMQKYGGQ